MFKSEVQEKQWNKNNYEKVKGSNSDPQERNYPVYRFVHRRRDVDRTSEKSLETNGRNCRISRKDWSSSDERTAVCLVEFPWNPLLRAAPVRRNNTAEEYCEQHATLSATLREKQPSLPNSDSARSHVVGMTMQELQWGLLSTHRIPKHCSFELPPVPVVV